jgi:hypothetical protein
MQKLYGTNFDAPNAHFNKLCLSDAKAERLKTQRYAKTVPKKAKPVER